MHPTITTITRTARICGQAAHDPVRLVRIGSRPEEPIRDSLGLIPLGYALEHRAASVREKNNASVGAVEIINHTPKHYIVGIAGEIITGGLQDRLLNVSIVIPGGMGLEVPVSCVERSRWAPTSPPAQVPPEQPLGASPDPQESSRRFRSGHQVASSAVRTATHNTVIRTLHGRGPLKTDQMRIWETVDQTLAGARAASRTHTLRAAYEAKQRTLQELAGHLRPAVGQVGVAMFWGDRFRSLDLFGSEFLLQHYHGQLVQAAAVDSALDSGLRTTDPEHAVGTLLGSLDRAEVLRHRPVVGNFEGGEQVWLRCGTLVATALMFNSQLVHLVASARTEDGQLAGPPLSR